MKLDGGAWVGQVTTGHGAMILGPTLLAAAGGQMSWAQATPLLIAGVIGLMWPENTALKTAAQNMTTDVEALVAAYRAGLDHGGAVVVAEHTASPAPAAAGQPDGSIAKVLGAIALLLVAGICLSACGTLPVAAPGTPGAAIQSGVATAQADIRSDTASTVADAKIDLAAAIAKANAATPPDTEFTNCVTYLQTNGSPLLAQLGGATAPLCSAPICPATAFESARLGLMGIGSALSPTSRTAFETTCGPLDMSIRNQTLTAAAAVAALLAKLGVKIAVPATLAVP